MGACGYAASPCGGRLLGSASTSTSKLAQVAYCLASCHPYMLVQVGAGWETLHRAPPSHLVAAGGGGGEGEGRVSSPYQREPDPPHGEGGRVSF